MYKVIYHYMITTDMKLTQEQLETAYNEVIVGHHEALGTIIRMGGDKEDYSKLYTMVFNGRRA